MLLEYSSSFHTSTRVLASKKQIFVTLSLHMIFKTHYFFYTRVLGLRILTRVLLEYSSTNTSSDIDIAKSKPKRLQLPRASKLKNLYSTFLNYFLNKA